LISLFSFSLLTLFDLICVTNKSWFFNLEFSSSFLPSFLQKQLPFFFYEKKVGFAIQFVVESVKKQAQMKKKKLVLNSKEKRREREREREIFSVLWFLSYVCACV
jgi:hypothetical protein